MLSLTDFPVDATQFSQISDPESAPQALQPSVRSHSRRMHVQPAGVVSTRPQHAKRAPTDANSLNAPYVKLTPILDDDTNAMIVDDVDEIKPRKYDAPEMIKDPTIVAGSLFTGHVMVTERSFLCPLCHRDNGIAMTYRVQGYSVQQDFLHRNYFPLLGIFLSWSGFRSPYASNIIKSTLEEHYKRDKSRVHIPFCIGRVNNSDHQEIHMTTCSLKAGNNRPSAMDPYFEWLKNINHEGNLLIFVNTHSDTKTGNLVVSGNVENPESVPIHELLSNYIGDGNLKVATKAITAINNDSGVGPCVRGLVISACGSMGRLTRSAMLLRRIVECDIFDFVLTFAGISTMDLVMVPVLNQFIKNVYIYDMKFWDAQEESFGEDKHALNQSPYYGKHWLTTNIKYECLQCNTKQKAIPCPTWIHAARSQNYGRVWYEWPLTAVQEQQIGIIS
ncbi:hypothetical protein BDR03DRAFT_983107 [Suillus americanus]|nr:hypothetical protein BDR03DRAFT_983107 [Suillus americanus]